jgi:hypothetical protein
MTVEPRRNPDSAELFRLDLYSWRVVGASSECSAVHLGHTKGHRIASSPYAKGPHGGPRFPNLSEAEEAKILGISSC